MTMVRSLNIPPVDAESKFRESFIKAKRAFKSVLKTQDNPFFKSKYASLADIHHAVDDALLTNGFTLHQVFTPTEHGNVLTTKLCHLDGFIEISTIRITTKDDTDPQKVKSASTYYRRIALEALLGIATEDDDGNEAASGTPKGHPTTAKEFRMSIPKNRNLGKTLDEMGMFEVQNDFNYWAGRVKKEGKPAAGAVKEFLEQAEIWLEVHTAVSDKEPPPMDDSDFRY